MLTISATCKLCKYKKTTFGVKTEISNCALWSRWVKHLEDVHYLQDPKDVEEAITNPKAHWDDLEDRKARLQRVDTRLQGQSSLDECMEEYGRGSVERKCFLANLERLCTVENLPLHISTQLGFLKFMRKWEPRWPTISKQSMTRLVACQSRELHTKIKREMEEVAKENGHSFHD